LQGKDARTSCAKNATFFEIAAEVTGNSNLGLQFGQCRDTRDAGLIGYVGLHSPTAAEALKNLSRYCRVMSDALTVDIGNLGEAGKFSWWQRGSPSRQMIEFQAANLLRGLREIIGRQLMPVSVTFAHPRNEGIEEFERVFGCPVNFGRDANMIELNQADLRAPVVTADARLLDLLHGYCEEVLAQHRERPPSLVDDVERHIVDRLASAEARLEIVAKNLGMSPRSLSRALAKLGTSFNTVVETLRRELAHKYLEQSDLSLSEIAFLLGYTEVSTFNHAIKRWTGETPGQIRKRQLAPAR